MYIYSNNSQFQPLPRNCRACSGHREEVELVQLKKDKIVVEKK